MTNATLEYLPANASRGITGLVAFAMIFFGGSSLWGLGGGFLALGVALYIDASSDEAIERITRTKRGKLGENDGNG